MTSEQPISSVPTFPHPGIRVHRNSHGNTVVRLHYDADPAKGGGPKTSVPEINLELSEWALKQYQQMTDPNLYLREYEINAEATLGRLIFNLDEEATLEERIEMAPNWTRRMSLDPHPSVPHAFLWCATDPYGDRWYYRELWPSRSCFRYEKVRLVGKPGPVPEDEPVISIKDYVETIKYLESSDNPENEYHGQRFDEQIFARVIDYAARAFGKGTNDDAEQPNFQQRYEQYMVMPQTRVSCPSFSDAKKDRAVGFEMVNAGLKPRLVEVANGVMKKRSKIHIIKEACPELIWQLKNNRRQILTPLQAESKDPTGKMIEVRKHQTDNMRYIEMSNPIFLHPEGRSSWEPLHQGIAY